MLGDTVRVDGIEYVIAWDGTADRQRKTKPLTGDYEQPPHGTEKVRRGQGAERKPHTRWPSTYARAKKEVNR